MSAAPVTLTLAELRERYPKLPGESLLQYQMRLGGLHQQMQSAAAASPAQGARETNTAFGLRQGLGAIAGSNPFEPINRAIPQMQEIIQAPGRMVVSGLGNVAEALRFATDTPARRETRATARAQRDSAARPAGGGGTRGTPSPASAFPTSFRDPKYDEYDRRAAAEFGVPFEVLQSIRVNGERSNANQVSSAGARTPYQIIPATAKGIQKNYGFNPLGNPQDAARGAAAVLAEGARRNGGDWGLAVREYHGGLDRSQWGPVNGAYAQRVLGERLMGAAQNFGASPPPFNDAGYDQAMALTQQAGQLAQQPTTVEYQELPRPERAAPTPFAAPDTSAGDAAFAAAAPQSPWDEPGERAKTVRQHYFKGMAQALATMNWSSGPGLGELFARVGAGALMGRIAGDEFVTQKEEQFDAQMRQYNLALASRNDAKATQIANVANQNTEQLNRYNDQTFSDRLQEWARKNPRIEGGNLLTYDMKNGKTQVTITPIGQAAAVNSLLNQAQIAMRRGEALNSHDLMTFRHGQEVARAGLGYVLSNPQFSSEQKDEAAAGEIMGRVNALVSSGRWADTFRNKEFVAEATLRAQQAAGIQPGSVMAPTKEQQELMNDYLTTSIFEFVMKNPETAIPSLYGHPAAVGAHTLDRLRNTRTSTTRDSRGRTSTRVSEAFE